METIIFYKKDSEAARSVMDKFRKAKPGDCIPLTDEEFRAFEHLKIVFLDANVDIM